ncbi:MAG: thiamine pyrophosphate-binding protein [Veillonellaceae bacterium]|nr:thiamine pyrophosphate-binding protein [Veillonellaceae bacterium]
MLMKLSDYVMQYLAARGVRDVFTLPGGGCMHLTDSLGRTPELNHVCMLHEQAAAIAADAYAQYRGGFGVCLVTTGPGGTNAITGVCASWIDSTPVLVISGQVKRADLMSGRGVRQMGNQEVDIVSIIKPVTKYAVTISEPNSIRYHLEKAVQAALTGRQGPVWLDIPLDVQAAVIDEDRLESFSPDAVMRADELAKVADATVDFLKQAQCPVLLAGCGIRKAGGEAEFNALIDLLQIPVLTTWRAADLIPDNHPCFAGRPGSIAQRGANYTQQRADLLLIIGARLDLPQTAYNHRQFAPKAKKIIVDIDANEIGKLDMPFSLSVEADAKEYICALHAKLQEQHWQKSNPNQLCQQNWLNQTLAWKKQYPVILPEYWASQEQGVNTYCLIDRLSELMDEGDILVPGSSGACAEITMQAFRFKAGQRVLNCPGLGAMGFDLPMALGAAVASNGKRVVCIAGDGGIQLNIQELATMKRLNLPIKLFILNNQGYGSIRNTQRNYFDGRYVCSNEESGLYLPDMIKVAAGYGITNYRLHGNAAMRSETAKILNEPGPCIVDVVTPPDLPTAPRVMSRQKSGGGMETTGMEDLWPEIDENLQ